MFSVHLDKLQFIEPALIFNAILIFLCEIGYVGSEWINEGERVR